MRSSLELGRRLDAAVGGSGILVYEALDNRMIVCGPPDAKQQASTTDSLPQVQRQRHSGQRGVRLVRPSRAIIISRPNERPTSFIADLSPLDRR